MRPSRRSAGPRHRARRSEAEFPRMLKPRSACAATASVQPDARAAPTARAMGSWGARAALRGYAIQDAANLRLELIGSRAIDVELGADRIADRPGRRAVRRVLRQQERTARPTQRLDALEMVRTHGENEIGR